jgi:hypothetical protein
VKRLALGGLSALIIATALSGVARAETIIGSSLPGIADGGGFSSGFTVVQTTQANGVDLPLTAPSAGALVKVRFSHGVAPAGGDRIGLRIVSGTFPNFTSRLDSRLPDLTYLAGDPAGTTTVIPGDAFGARGVRIEAGERLGVATLVGTMDINRANPGARYSYFNSTGAGPGVYATFGADYDVTLQYVIEPDADGDGWGDETQDRCPADPTSNCPGRIVTVPGPVVIQQSPPIVKTIVCGTGTKPAGEACVKIKCRIGHKLRGSKCVKIKCAKGRRLKGNKCVKRKPARARTSRVQPQQPFGLPRP